jgi:hypothetical protein
MVVSNTLQNLLLDIQGTNEGAKPGGAPVQRVITLKNRGSREAKVELWIDPVDARAEPLQQWGSFSEVELALKAGETRDVILTFSVPLQAEPGFYSYDIRAQSPQYPSERIQRSQQLQILPSNQDTGLLNEPDFTLDPLTDSTTPATLAVGQTLEVKVFVKNNSKRTDRFFLTCPDLPIDWFHVEYPENSSELVGLVKRTEGLQLNPKEAGEIKLFIHPPQYTPAGNYFPTVRLSSKNHEDLILFEIVYLTIKVDDRLDLILRPLSRTIPSTDETFEIQFINPGNINRNLTIHASDQREQLLYSFDFDQVELPPGSTDSIQLSVTPKRWWHRLWRLREHTLLFHLDLKNAPIESPDENLVEAASDLLIAPALPQQLPQGTIIWKAHHRWLFWLIVVSIALGLLTSTALLVWYLFFFIPNSRPRIIDFSTTEESYREGGNQSVTLDWDVSNLAQVGSIRLSYEGQTEPKQYFFKDIIPPELEPFCKVEMNVMDQSIFATVLRRLGIRSNQGNAQQSNTTETPNLNREGAYLRCRGVIPPNFEMKEGRYEFKLEIFDKKSADLQAVSILEDVIVASPAPPKILDLSATATEYSVSDVPFQLAVNPSVASEPETPQPESLETSNQSVNETTQPIQSTQTPAPAAQTTTPQAQTTSGRPSGPIRLNWEISNHRDIQELRLVSFAPDGSENTDPITYRFSDEASDQIPPELGQFCRSENNNLICAGVPTNAEKVGEYTFQLKVISREENTEGEISQKTSLIPIKPQPPKIVQFLVNGQNVLQQPKQVYLINPARGAIDLVLSWQVENSVKVELLPAPGAIDVTQLNYPLSPSPGSETITLKVTNASGEEVTQSVVIEKVASAQANSISPANPANPLNPATGNSNSPLPPPPPLLPVPVPPTLPDDLPVYELPPQAN